jgi:diphthine-ammonia ligase
MKAFCSWSGGKDSAMALYRAVKNNEKNIDVSHCLNMINEDGKYSRSHGIPVEVLQLQAAAMECSIVQQPAAWENYEEKFKQAVTALKEEGVKAGVFGDIDLADHREWVERVCKEMDITPFLPLWLGKREELLEEFIDNGFKAVVTTVDSAYMGNEWLGRLIDREFMEDIKKQGNIDLCGENGEFHTLVLDGPFFKKSIEILESEPVKIEKHWFLNITRYCTKNK